MAKYTPHYSLYKIISSINKVKGIAFWLILLLSILPILFKSAVRIEHAIDILNIANIIGIALFFILEIIVEYILIPQAEKKRRDDFIDNSFGSRLSLSSSVEYYDNEEVKQGLYKGAVNLFQNSFFTYGLLSALSKQRIVIPAIITTIIAVFAYYGFKEVPFALSILQAFFSANILGLLIKHLILLSRMDIVHQSWIALFQNNNVEADIHKYQAQIFRNWIMYETLISQIHPDIPEDVYDKCNPTLTEKWNALKVKYSISKV